jgi:hypothetical protein
VIFLTLLLKNFDATKRRAIEAKRIQRTRLMLENP